MHFLVITDKYYPRPYANAVCAQELIDELKSEGHSVDVLAYKDYGIDSSSKWNGNKVYYVAPDIRRQLFYYADNLPSSPKARFARFVAVFLNRTKKAFLIPWHPLYSISLIGRVYRFLKQLVKAKDYDSIIVVVHPFENAVAACRLKTIYPNKPIVIYAVDSLRNDRLKYNGAFANGFFWEKRIMERCSRYFYMKARRDEFALPRYDVFRGKMVEVDLPRLKIKDVPPIDKFDFGTKGENWVYAGSLGGIHYEPGDMIEIFLEIVKHGNKNLHMYVRGNEADSIRKFAIAHGLPIYVHDYVDPETLQEIMFSADVLVTLKTSSYISAKIFECMSYLKPIVHFSGVEDDANAVYYRKSDAYFVFKMYESDRQAEMEKLYTWLSNINHINITKEQVIELYAESTPEYSVKKILECINQAKQ